MTRRWAWWTGFVLILVVFVALGVRKLSREIPGLMAKAGDRIRQEAAALGLQVTFRNLRFHPLHLRVSLEGVEVRDGVADLPLARAEYVDASLSPRRLLSGLMPVSRIRVRKFVFHAGEGNRALLERVRSARTGEETGELPEILLFDGDIRIGPLGPLERWEAKIPEARIRPVRFLGTRVTVGLTRSSGFLAFPGPWAGNLPFGSAEADLFLKGKAVRVRKFRASGPAGMLSLSGRVDAEPLDFDLKFSGEADIGPWTASGFLGGEWLRRAAAAGKVVFSAGVKGSPDAPEGAGKIVARQVLIPGGTPLDAEISASLSGRRVRLESVRGTLWGGTIAGSGALDLDKGEGEGKVTLARAEFGKAPWKSWGTPWRPAGRGDLAVSLSGGRDKVHGAVSARIPAGFEREGGAHGSSSKVSLPVSADLIFDLVGGKELSIGEFRLAAGKGEITGKGTYTVPRRTLSFSGGLLVPKGRAADYGWAYPLSWGGLSGDWEVSGTAGNPHVAAEMSADDLAARKLPPVPLSVKLDGDPADVIHFVADIPVDVAKVTATGTVTGPLSADPPILEATVAARDIDFSRVEKWGAAVLSSLGKDPRDLVRRVTGLSGTGTADLQISIGRNAHSVSGTLTSPEVRFPQIAVRTVSASGNWGETPSGPRWGYRAGGEVGGGVFLLAGKGEGEKGEISGSMEKIDLDTAATITDPKYKGRIGGQADLRFDAGTGRAGWEVREFSAFVPVLTADGVSIEGVSAKGTLGEEEGTVSIGAESPRAHASARIRRTAGWPADVTVSVEDVPAKILLGALGKKEIDAGGTWNASAGGSMMAADLFSGKPLGPDSFPNLTFSVSAESPSVSGVSFDALRADGRKEEGVLVGEIVTRLPDSRLAFSLALREPFGFRVEGPFTVARNGGPPDLAGSSGENGTAGGNGRPRIEVAGKVQIAGTLSGMKNTRGTLQVRRLLYRNGGFDMAGEGISILLSSDGIRWAEGVVHAAGNPLRVSGKASWSGDLDARVEGKIPAQAIRLATDIFDRLDGTVRMELRITGRWDDPAVIGTGHLEKGMFSFRGYAQLFEEMSADAVISREKIVFEHFEGRSGGGYIDGRGELPLRFADGQKMYFTVDFFDMRYPYPEDLRPVLQGHVELIGPIENLLVTGDVEVQSARYSKTVRPEQALLDFRRRLADVTARRKESDFRIRLDIEALADGTILVKNNLAEAEIKGEFKVVGDTSRVILLGSFDVTEGQVEYRGNRYELMRGGVEFQDPRRNNPRLDFRAETRRGNVVVTVSVTGTLEKYEVEFFSDPPLGKNDIVSLLSLGVTSESLAGAEGSVSAAEAAAIALGPYKGRVEEEIRDVIGLDRFAIEPSFSSTDKSFEPRFIVGKTFGDRFTVSVSTNVGTTTESKAVAEFKVYENIYLQGAWESATTTREGDLGGDVKFRYRYRSFRDIFGGGD